MVHVKFSGSAFVTLIISCIEVYRRESFGIILGHKEKNNFIIKTCLPFQTAKRGYTSTSLALSKEKSINEVLQCLSKDFMVGDFHSHPGKVIEYLSEQDKIDMKREKRDFISILVIIKKAKKYKKWGYTKHENLAGTVGKFFVKLKGFQFIKKKGIVRKIKIRCQYIKKLNKTYCDINMLKFK